MHIKYILNIRTSHNTNNLFADRRSIEDRDRVEFCVFVREFFISKNLRINRKPGVVFHRILHTFEGFVIRIGNDIVPLILITLGTI